jgi:Undecaprenyl-phosphate glucose phosphotransferase
MLKKHSQVFEGLFSASDLIVVSLAWVLSYWLRFRSGLFIIDKGIPPITDYFRMLLFVWLIWAFVFRRFGLYRPMRGTSRFREVLRVARANSLSVVLLLAATYLFREKSVPFSRLVFVIFWVVSTFAMIGSRSLVRGFLRSMRKKGFNIRYALIVGNGSLAGVVANRMLGHPEYGIELAGCLSRDKSEVTQPSVVESAKLRARDRTSDYPRSSDFWRESGSNVALAWNADSPNSEEEIELPVVGTYADLPAFLECGRIDQVIIALPLSDHRHLEDVIAMIGDSIVDVRIVPDVHRFIQLGSQVEEFDGLPVVSLASTPLAGINRVTKRVFDMTLGPLFLLFAFPLMLLIGLAVKFSSPGPVFFSQERLGLDGRLFKIYKFRTMRTDAERGGARFAVKNDPRTTAIGSFLRRYSLDELPQLVNVIAGHMSLVGPRPERPVFIEEFRRRIPKYMLRHKVQAGMTGWAQVNGWRGNTSIEKRIEHDLFYIEHWSLFLDLKILFLTVFKGISDRNAY